MIDFIITAVLDVGRGEVSCYYDIKQQQKGSSRHGAENQKRKRKSQTEAVISRGFRHFFLVDTNDNAFSSRKSWRASRSDDDTVTNDRSTDLR